MTASGLDAAGFVGFFPFNSLVKQSPSQPDGVPDDPGVYAVVREAVGPPAFLTMGTGGHFKDRDPNVAVEVLEAEWVHEASIGTSARQEGAATELTSGSD